jgi:hypothetical protein
VAGQTIEVALGDPGPAASFQIPPKLVPFVDSVFAEIDNGAGSDTVPTLEVRGPNGDTVAAVPQDAVLPGGDTGRVTWALRLAAKAAAPTSAVPVYAQAFLEFTSGDAPQSVNAGATANAGFPHASTTDSNVILWSTQVNPNDTANLLSGYTYLMFASSLWDQELPTLSTEISGTYSGGFRHRPNKNNQIPTFVSSDGQATSQDFAVAHVTGGGQVAHVLLGNQEAVAHSSDATYFTIIGWPTG